MTYLQPRTKLGLCCCLNAAVLAGDRVFNDAEAWAAEVFKLWREHWTAKQKLSAAA